MSELSGVILDAITTIIKLAIARFEKLSDHLEMGEYLIYWTPHGTIAVKHGEPAYYFHNNGTIFLFKHKESEEEHKELGIAVFLSDSRNNDWMQPLFEMQYAVLTRAVATSVPKCTRLMEITEEKLEELPEREEREAIKWITC